MPPSFVWRWRCWRDPANSKPRCRSPRLLSLLWATGPALLLMCLQGSALRHLWPLLTFLPSLPSSPAASLACSLFSEHYMPHLNELPPDRLAREHSSFSCYLDLLVGGMEWRVVRTQMVAFLRVSPASPCYAGGMMHMHAIASRSLCGRPVAACQLQY